MAANVIHSTPARRVPEPIVVAMALEQHLGHETYAENLRAASQNEVDVSCHWVPVTYRTGPPPLESVPMPGGLRAVFNARHEMRGLARLRADVHVFNTQVPAVIGPRAARRPPYILVTDVTPRQYDRVAQGYGHRPDRPGPVGSAKHRWNRHVIRRACWNVAWSTWVRTSLVDDYGVPPERIRVIPPGVDIDEWRPAGGSGSTRVRILFVGGDFERKGGPELLDAFHALPAGTAELTIVTKSPVAGSESIAVVRDLQPNDARLVHLYRESDLFVLPSRAETFGIAAVEAAACGLPVIATAIGGLTDIVHDGVTGYTFRPGDTASLHDRLRRMVSRPETIIEFGREARSRAEKHFDATANAARLYELVRSCGGRHRFGPDAAATSDPPE